ncbi:MAG: DUF2804 domain-containing protein [Treponema sp.]|jgi:hypothetical protein|nr:DUF2804 domain-containing protein [Treponema sp.]
MYTREIQAPRTTPLENGVPLQGTWTRAFEEVDLLDIRKPYPIPWPAWIRDFRIKEWERFIIQDDRYCLFALFCNLKIFRIASLTMYDRETGEHLRCRKIIPGRGWHLPKRLNNASVDSRSMGFFFRIHAWLDSGTVSLDLDVEPGRTRPSFTAYAKYNIHDSGQNNTPMAVSLLFSERRSMYAYKVMAPVQGDMVFGGRHIYLDPAKTAGIFCDFKGFYPYRMQTCWCSATGFDQAGRRFGFSLAENQARESFRNNENALWLDGRLTPLPPVMITMPGGINSEWVIQDMEGMVDLVFTPRQPSSYTMNLLACRSDHQNPIGVFNGVMVNAQGEEIQIKNLWGISEKLYLRV